MGVFAEIRNAFECFCKCNIFVWEIDKIGYTRVVSEQIGYLFFATGRAYAICQLCVGSSVLG